MFHQKTNLNFFIHFPRLGLTNVSPISVLKMKIVWRVDFFFYAFIENIHNVFSNYDPYIKLDIVFQAVTQIAIRLLYRFWLFLVFIESFDRIGGKFLIKFRINDNKRILFFTINFYFKYLLKFLSTFLNIVYIHSTTFTLYIYNKKAKHTIFFRKIELSE